MPTSREQKAHVPVAIGDDHLHGVEVVALLERLRYATQQRRGARERVGREGETRDREHESDPPRVREGTERRDPETGTEDEEQRQHEDAATEGGT